MILINSSPQDALKIFQPFLPIFVPVGIGYLISAAEAAGIEAKFIDEQVEDNVLGLVDEYVKGLEKPYIFGFSVLTAAFKKAISLSEEVKRRYPDSVILFGGIHPTAMPDEVLAFGHIDAVIRGEAEKSIIEFYRCVKEGEDYSAIDNLSYKKDGRVIHNDRVEIPDHLDTFPQFPYHRFNPQRYDLGFVIGSRGCPYKCIFCSNRISTGLKYRYRSSASIADELAMLNEKYGRKYILFLDDNFLVNKRRVYELIGEIKKRGLDKKMTFNFQARGDNVDREILKNLFDGGFRSIFFGIETASDKIMETIKKGETVAQCSEAVRMAKEIGFHVSATFIYALPGETHKDRMDCVKMSKALEIDMVRYNNATPYPGTELYKIAKKEGRLHVEGLYENFNSVSTFIENPFKKIPFSYVPVGNTESEIRRDLLFSYYSFYLDVGRLKKLFARPDQGVGWFNAGENLLDFARKLPAMFALGSMMLFKFCQLFYYMVLRKDTAISFRYFLNIFVGASKKKGHSEIKAVPPNS